ncbi:Cytosolic Fe-S cluster assembly factor NAR1 [Yarrowia sp. C11]|nr:Cytosolic Fe-S cluster assembly factor NAR1 [Yarrowia sp. E02]KAG5371506.1 Cytosolic Fe-S cluster assembly factor NAR1 [Yarrowia sp. C11]
MSSILSADDLNDFISPGAVCIKPIKVDKTREEAEIEIGAEGQALEVGIDGTQKELEPAQLSLSDCLACSGCITSAESVLVALQSHTQLLDELKKEAEQRENGAQKRIFVCSVSHQARASFAAAFGVSVEVADAKLHSLLLDTLGFDYIVGMGVGREISLVHSAQEVSQATQKPVMAASCPGWVCYVEKTHPHVIPYLSGVKSPQQICGSLLKKVICDSQNVTPSQVYHVSIMPCFDKKLEASRDEFSVEEAGQEEKIRDVDCVITTKEVVQLLAEKELSFNSLPEIEPARLYTSVPSSWPADRDWKNHVGSSSGGYLHHVLTTLRLQHDPQESRTRVDAQMGKNQDVMEYSVVDTETGETVASAAQVYGFRNIQNLVRKLKPSSLRGKGKVVSARKSSKTAAAALNPSQYSYIEVMACPGGCINGGGQVGAPEGVAARDWKDETEKMYNSIPTEAVSQQVVEWAKKVWGGSEEKLVTAHYQEVEKVDQGLASTW